MLHTCWGVRVRVTLGVRGLTGLDPVGINDPKKAEEHVGSMAKVSLT